MPSEEGIYSSELKCSWNRVEAWGLHTIVLYVPMFDCTDMAGAIKMALKLNPRTRHVRVYSGGRLDIIYSKTSRKGWQAFEQDQTYIRGPEALRA